jgi:hypothetical protein
LADVARWWSLRTGQYGSPKAAIASAAAWDGTPATLLFLLQQHGVDANPFDIAKSKPATERWRAYVDEVSAADPAAARLLLLVAALRAILIRTPTVSFLERLYARLFDAKVGDAAVALRALQARAIVTITEGVVTSLRAVTDPDFFGLRTGLQLSSFATAVLEAVLAQPNDEELRQPLHHIASYYANVHADEQRRKILERIRTAYPDDPWAAMLLSPPPPRPAHIKVNPRWQLRPRSR